MATARTDARTDVIIEVLQDAFAPLMRTDPAAFRAKYRKMARDPLAFYRGSACLFYCDVTGEEDDWADRGAERIWIHGDLHVENFGTYLNSDGRLIFDINDFDEAYLGRFTWDLQRFAASLALVGWQKALPEESIRKLVARYARSYLAQVNHYVASDDDHDFAIRIDNADGPILTALTVAREMRRADPSRPAPPSRRCRTGTPSPGRTRAGRAQSCGTSPGTPPGRPASAARRPRAAPR